MDFIDRHPFVDREQRIRLFMRSFQDVEIIEGEVFARVRREQFTDQSAFPCLSCAGDDNHGECIQGLADKRCEMTIQRDVQIIHRVDDNHSCCDMQAISADLQRMRLVVGLAQDKHPGCGLWAGAHGYFLCDGGRDGIGGDSCRSLQCRSD